MNKLSSNENIDELFKKPVDFSYQIEMYLRDNKCQGYVDAIIKFCNEHSIDQEDIVGMISPTLKSKIAEEAGNYGVLIKGQSQPMMRLEC